MIKHKREHSLDRVRELIEEGHVRLTKSSVQTAGEMDISESGMLDIISNLTPQHFTQSNHDRKFNGQWQDVYNTVVGEWHVYIKFKIWNCNGEEFLVLSFKPDSRYHD